jgi:predicted GIY-YIG superfamily endonuclease
MGARSFYVYILASRIGGTLYIGVTNDLIRRLAEHRLELADGFTKKTPRGWSSRAMTGSLSALASESANTFL